MNSKKRFRWIRIITVIAILVSSFLVYQHYKTTPSRFCKFGESFDCGIVNKSPYSTIDGILYFLHFDLGFSSVPLFELEIPVSAIGILIFLLIIAMSYKIEKNRPFLGLKPKKQIKIMKSLMALSIVFALYLVYIEAFVLLFYCIYCLVLDALIVAEAMLIKDLK